MSGGARRECPFCRSPVAGDACPRCGVRFPRDSLKPDGMFHAAKRAKHGPKRAWMLRFFTTLDHFLMGKGDR